MTANEIAMASLLFGDAIDYRRVRIHGRRYMPFQPKNCCMTPNGSMYFHRSCFLPDYTRGDPGAIHWFMHEMVHVWQHQLGYPVRLRGAVRIGLPYAYTLREDATLADYNMEAQGDLLADYFVLKFLRKPGAMRQGRYRDSLALYERVLASFLDNPRSRSHLHGRLARRAAYWTAGR
ncbi:Rhs element Vgr protein [Massilia agri]